VHMLLGGYSRFTVGEHSSDTNIHMFYTFWQTGQKWRPCTSRVVRMVLSRQE